MEASESAFNIAKANPLAEGLKFAGKGRNGAHNITGLPKRSAAREFGRGAKGGFLGQVNANNRGLNPQKYQRTMNGRLFSEARAKAVKDSDRPGAVRAGIGVGRAGGAAVNNPEAVAATGGAAYVGVAVHDARKKEAAKKAAAAQRRAQRAGSVQKSIEASESAFALR